MLILIDSQQNLTEYIIMSLYKYWDADWWRILRLSLSSPLLTDRTNRTIFFAWKTFEKSLKLWIHKIVICENSRHKIMIEGNKTETGKVAVIILLRLNPIHSSFHLICYGSCIFKIIGHTSLKITTSFPIG